MTVKRRLRYAAENILAALAPAIWTIGRSSRLLVLTYHRVLPPEHPDRKIEQPGMYVSPDTLDLHLAVLRRHFELVHLGTWLRRARDGDELPRIACALTFDDGWRDNFEHGYPILLHHRAPATIFLVSSLIGKDEEFWPNRLARLLAASRDRQLPAGRLGELLSRVGARAQANGPWTSQEIDQAIALMKELDEPEIHELIGAEQRLRGYATPGRVILNEEELRIMAASGLVQFGSHTKTHYRCRITASPATLRTEIIDSRAEITASVGAHVDLFCYPNGDVTPAARELVSQHYIGAVTTEKGWHSPEADPFQIRRIGVHEDISSRPASLLARISGWL